MADNVSTTSAPADGDLIQTTPEALRTAVTEIMNDRLPSAEDLAAVRALSAQRATDSARASALSDMHPDAIRSQFQAEHDRNVRYLGDPRMSRYRTREDLDRARTEAHVIGEYITHVHNKNIPGLDALRSKYPEFYRKNEDEAPIRANFNWTSSGQGVELVPEIWDSAILQVAEQYGYVNAIAKMYPMTAKTHKLNRGGTTTASMVGEATAPTPVDSTSFFAQTSMTAKAGAAAFITSLELITGATPEYIGFMTGELGRAHAQLRDEQFFNGSGSGANHTGLIGTSGVITTYMGDSNSSGKTAFSNVSWTDFVNLSLSLPSSAANNAMYIIPRSVFGYAVKEVDGVNGRPIWNLNQPVAAGAMQGVRPLGAPMWAPNGIPTLVVPNGLFPSSAASKVAAIFADLAQYGYFGNLTGFAINTFKEYYGSTALGGTRQIAIETTELFGLAFPAPAGIGVLKTAAS